MPSGLIPLHIHRPGILGENTQDSEGVLPGEFATVAVNLTLDEKGRLRCRPGTTVLTDTNSSGGETGWSGMVGGTARYFTVGDTKTITELVSGTWTAITVNAGVGGIKDNGAIYYFASFNNKVLMFANNPLTAGYVRHVQTSSGGAFNEIVASSGAVPVAEFMMADWGRVWCLSGSSLKWSGLLDETAWATGGAGSLDLRNVWPYGEDTPKALANFNNFLVVFGARTILIFERPDDDPATNMALVDTIPNVGIAHPKTIQSIGTDLLFMGPGGLMSLGRVIQEKSMPMSVVAPQVRDDMRNAITYSTYTAEEISSAYSERLGWYILCSDTGGYRCFVVHTKQRDAQGFMPVTEFSKVFAVGDNNIKWVADDAEQGMAIASISVSGVGVNVGRINPNVVKDNTATNETGGYAYGEVTYASGWLDFSEVDLGDREKLIKELRLIFEDCGSSNAMDVSLYANYDDTTAVWSYSGTLPYSATKTVTAAVLDAAGEYGVLKIKIVVTDPTDRFTLSRLDFYAKAGKISQ